jgi:alkylation response protein AidB-like acyl-CoA dehydrogenase
MDLRYSARHRALQEEARGFVKKYGHLSPKTGGGRKRPDARALDWQKLLLERGYFARNIPREYGGFGLPVDILELAIIAEEFSNAGVSPGIMNQGISMLVPTLLEVGTKEQCIQWIVPTIRGDIIWCPVRAPTLPPPKPAPVSRIANSSSMARKSGRVLPTTPT